MPRTRHPLACFATALAAMLVFATATRAEQPAPVAPLAEDQLEVRENVKYGSTGGIDLTMHLVRPKQIDEALPVIVYIHGGGWRAGNKDIHLSDAKRAAAQGYVSASVGYRFAPAHVFPAQVEDVKCAIRYLRAHAAELKLDPQRIGAIGYSAGAHLSMMLGTMDTSDGLEGDGGSSDQPSKVQAVVAYFGPTNLASIYPEMTTPILTQFLGGTMQEKPEAYRLASPVTYVNAGDAPTLIFQGTKDILVPYDQAFQMVTALTKAAVPGRVELLLGKGHGWGKEDLEQTQHAALEFFGTHLKKK